jgi:hypothetical protein
MKNCIVCSIPIPPERIEVLPTTTTCVKCSTTKAVVGFMIYNHKTAGTLVTIPPEESETLRIAKRANRRAR